jgi:FkbH-like protein
MIENKVKLVVWDLDDTFWQGSLLEGGITAVARNSEIVRTLSERGIVNSICSKNDPALAKAKLIELGIWEHFVFPAIGFHPKGKAIAEMIEAASLRAKNVLFIDDNPSNLEEAKFFSPRIMTGHPDDILRTILYHPNCAGNPDPELTRLKQYHLLERKFEDRSASSLSNEEFLRASNIRISIDHNIEGNFDRVVDLINRANQLNYTKVRLDTETKIEAFRKSLSEFGFHAGCVHAADNYGDYGLVGFFQLRRKAKDRSLTHFVFSCRTMNMGIEQYVYRELGQPGINIIGPVSSRLDADTGIDWINMGEASGATGEQTSSPKLVLLGGCDLLQLASYCSGERAEFVNRAEDDYKIRYDDPAFVLANREAVRTCEALQKIPSWSYGDAVRFDNALAEAKIAIISFWTGMNGDYCRFKNDLVIRLGTRQIERIQRQESEWFSANVENVALKDKERLDLIAKALKRIGQVTSAQCQIFVLGSCTHGRMGKGNKERRETYNETMRQFCNYHRKRFHYLDLNALMSPSDLTGKGHFTRSSYFNLARHIMGSLGEAEIGHFAKAAYVPLAEAAE